MQPNNCPKNDCHLNLNLLGNNSISRQVGYKSASTGYTRYQAFGFGFGITQSLTDGAAANF